MTPHRRTLEKFADDNGCLYPQSRQMADPAELERLLAVLKALSEPMKARGDLIREAAKVGSHGQVKLKVPVIEALLSARNDILPIIEADTTFENLLCNPYSDSVQKEFRRIYTPLIRFGVELFRSSTDGSVKAWLKSRFMKCARAASDRDMAAQAILDGEAVVCSLTRSIRPKAKTLTLQASIFSTRAPHTMQVAAL